jgi:hypothetical protein
LTKSRQTGEDWHLERCQNPQAGKPALRGADILVCGFWGLSSPQLRTGVELRPIKPLPFFFIELLALAYG